MHASRVVVEVGHLWAPPELALGKTMKQQSKLGESLFPFPCLSPYFGYSHQLSCLISNGNELQSRFLSPRRVLGLLEGSLKAVGISEMSERKKKAMNE